MNNEDLCETDESFIEILFLIMLELGTQPATSQSKENGVYGALFFFQFYVTQSKVDKFLGNGCELKVNEAVNLHSHLERPTPFVQTHSFGHH